MKFFSLNLTESLSSCNGTTALTGHYESGRFIVDTACPQPARMAISTTDNFDQEKNKIRVKTILRHSSQF